MPNLATKGHSWLLHIVEPEPEAVVLQQEGLNVVSAKMFLFQLQIPGTCGVLLFFQEHWSKCFPSYPASCLRKLICPGKTTLGKKEKGSSLVYFFKVKSVPQYGLAWW